MTDICKSRKGSHLELRMIFEIEKFNAVKTAGYNLYEKKYDHGMHIANYY